MANISNSDMALARVGFIPIPPGKEPGFDHADVYRCQSPAASRLYVAHTGADRIDIIDCLSNSYLRSLPDMPGVAGILIDSEQDLLFLIRSWLCSGEHLSLL